LYGLTWDTTLFKSLETTFLMFSVFGSHKMKLFGRSSVSLRGKMSYQIMANRLPATLLE